MSTIRQNSNLKGQLEVKVHSILLKNHYVAKENKMFSVAVVVLEIDSQLLAKK